MSTPSNPSATDIHRAERLQRIGVTEPDLAALEQLWDRSRAFGLIADDRSGSLAGWGYSALDSLDAIWHELDEADAHLYMQHHYTPHQAFLLATHTQAGRNLWGPGSDLDRVHELLDAALPRPLVAKALLVATSPDEAETLLKICTGDHPGDPERAVADIEAQAAALADRVDECDCPWSTN